MGSPSDDTLTALRAEVVQAARRHHHDHRHPLAEGRALAAAAVATMVIGAVLLARPEQVAAGVQVTVDSDGMTITVEDLAVRPEDVEAAAALAGHSVDVVAVPVGPSMVGRFVGMDGSGPDALVELRGGSGPSGFHSLHLPTGFAGSITVRIGRPATSGEEWAVLSDATAPGELLACSELVGRPVGEVVAAADDAGADPVRVMLLDEARWLTPDEVEASSSAQVVRVTSRSGREIWIDAMVDTTLGWGELPPPEGC